MSSYVAQRNGSPATIEDLTPLAFAGYAHMSAMQVREGGVRGLDLHLDRLRYASKEMFGHALSDDRIRSHLRTAIAASSGDVSLLVTVYSPAGEFTAEGFDAEPQVLIRTSAAFDGPEGPLSLATVEHERAVPAIKHVGEIAKTYYLREAVAKGFDDAAFIDRRGRYSEASIWNLAFRDGDTVVWPDAEMLTGTMMGVIRRQLELRGIPQRVQEIRPADLPRLSGAVVMNSWTPGVPVNRIDATTLPDAASFVELLRDAYLAEPLAKP